MNSQQTEDYMEIGSKRKISFVNNTFKTNNKKTKNLTLSVNLLERLMKQFGNKNIPMPFGSN